MSDHRRTDESLAQLLHAAAAPAESPLPGEEAALAAYRAEFAPSHAGRRRARLVAVALSGGVLMIGGAAAAATGTLPSVTGHGHGQSGNHGHANGTENGSNHGSEVSEVARDKSTKGADHGAAVCTVASAGKCKAGQQGEAGDEHGKPDEPGSSADHPKPAKPHPSATSHQPTTGTSHRHLPAPRKSATPGAGVHATSPANQH